MTHMITATGQEYHFTGAWLWPSHRPICVEDIAHQLAQINRFHGACRRPYSVAEHSLLVSQLAARAGLPPVGQLAALMHDAHEAYTNDLASPAKRAVDAASAPHGCNAWRLFEDQHADNLRRHFGLQTAFAGHRATLQELDLIAVATERHQLTAYQPQRHSPWACLRDDQPNPVLPAVDVHLMDNDRCLTTWAEWRDRFLQRFADLTDQVRDWGRQP